MKDKLILIFVEHNKSDDEAYCRKYGTVYEGGAVKVGHKFGTVNNCCSEGFDYAVKGINLKQLSLPRAIRKSESLNGIYNRCEIEEKKCENVIKVFDILEEDIECAENHTNTEGEHKKHRNGKGCKNNVKGKIYGVVVDDFKEKNYPCKYGKRNNEGNEG